MTSSDVMMCTHIKRDQITTGPKGTGASSSVHSVTNPECLKMQKTGLEKAMHHLGVLGISTDDLKHSGSLGSTCCARDAGARQKRTSELP